MDLAAGDTATLLCHPAAHGLSIDSRRPPSPRALRRSRAVANPLASVPRHAAAATRASRWPLVGRVACLARCRSHARFSNSPGDLLSQIQLSLPWVDVTV